MAYLLFPGRHIINTVFQKEYLYRRLQLPLGEIDYIGNQEMDPEEQIETIIFAVTSANQENSRYNPVPFYVRTIQLDRFARIFKEVFGVSYRIVGVPHFPPTDKFAAFTIKELEATLAGESIKFTPENTLVLCSTPNVLKLYQGQGYNILPAEYEIESNTYVYEPPSEIIRQVAQAENDCPMSEKVVESTREVWNDFPHILKSLKKLWTDPLLTNEGSLTSTRNYSVYAFGMADKKLLELKYNDIKEVIVPGRIADEGCADGALLVPVAHDFPDSDLLGIEITGEFIARCKERLRAGEYGGTYVHFYQRNILERVFEPETIDTTICNSTLHELYSYAGREEAIRNYLSLKYDQLRNNGRLIIRDVVGPEDKEDEVYMWLNQEDGFNENIFAEFDSPEQVAAHVAGLSSHARFLRFAQDFLPSQASRLSYREEEREGGRYFIVRLKDAAEFLTTKDYTANWQSEMYEEFTFWSFSEWKEELIRAGFFVLESSNREMESSRVYTNQWIVENRFRGTAKLFHRDEYSGVLQELPYPVTNMVLIGEKQVKLNDV